MVTVNLIVADCYQRNYLQIDRNLYLVVDNVALLSSEFIKTGSFMFQ